MPDNIYTDRATGDQVRIINEDTNFYELDNSVRIKKEVFHKKYTESVEIDPNAFFSAKSVTNDPLLNLANQLKSIDTRNIHDAPEGGTRVKYTPPVTISDTSMSGQALQQKQNEELAKQLTPEERKAMIDNFRATMPGADIPSVQNRNWDDEEERFLNGDKPIEARIPEPKVDPIQMMFKMFKNNYPVKLNVEIEENIPNPTFIGMVQENVEADAVEYYANLIADKILKDPTNFRAQVYDQLKVIINKELGVE
jgi:hypothetical protein